MEASDQEVISEEVSYSHSSESDNEEDQEDAIEKKQRTGFNTAQPGSKSPESNP